ncbi:MAG: GIY-YIG nuclease family protein [Patescibacteria group bacterium]|nr:GIY-YIG nuclease family protein [Patescibacteria group bacterium]
MRQYFVYIMTNERYGTLYIGVTSDLVKRAYEHKNGFVEGFTEKYKLHRLVYYEQTENVTAAIEREKQLKTWKRQWKIELIDKFNPEWKDLYKKII